MAGVARSLSRLYGSMPAARRAGAIPGSTDAALTAVATPIRATLNFLGPGYDRSKKLVFRPLPAASTQMEVWPGPVAPTCVSLRDARASEERRRVRVGGGGFLARGYALLKRPEAAVAFGQEDTRVAVDAADAAVHALGLRRAARGSGDIKVAVFDVTRRGSSVGVRLENGLREPARHVHNDYTASSGKRRVRSALCDVLGMAPGEADRLMNQRRAIIVNVWRGATTEPVTSWPLALCDAATMNDDELVPMERKSETTVGEIQRVLHGTQQKWLWFSRLTPDEAIVFKTYDSAAADRGAPFCCPHAAFDVSRATAPAHTAATSGAPWRDEPPPRISVEARVAVVLPEGA